MYFAMSMTETQATIQFAEAVLWYTSTNWISWHGGVKKYWDTKYHKTSRRKLLKDDNLLQ